MTKKLTEMQRRFVDEYIITGNATKAAIKAGYAKKTAGGNADRLLKRPQVAAYLKQQREKISSEKIASAQEVLEYLSRVMKGEESETIATNKGDIVELPPKISDRNKAAELIGKRYRLFVDRTETDTNGQVAINIVPFGDDDS